MEGKKQLGSSPSFTSELFGSKDSSSSNGIFSSMFAPPSKVLGRGSLQSEVMGKKKQDCSNEAWNTKPEAQDETSKSYDGEGYNIPNRDTSPFYQEQRVQPCHLSSSIYYGGQDIYHHPQNSQNANMTSMFKKDGTEDDSGSASRGNWWQGTIMRLTCNFYSLWTLRVTLLDKNFTMQGLSITKISPAMTYAKLGN